MGRHAQQAGSEAVFRTGKQYSSHEPSYQLSKPHGEIPPAHNVSQFVLEDGGVILLFMCNA